jgi:hypothetical protein
MMMRASVLERCRPLQLWPGQPARQRSTSPSLEAGCGPQSARGLAQSKTLRVELGRQRHSYGVWPRRAAPGRNEPTRRPPRWQNWLPPRPSSMRRSPTKSSSKRRPKRPPRKRSRPAMRSRRPMRSWAARPMRSPLAGIGRQTRVEQTGTGPQQIGQAGQVGARGLHCQSQSPVLLATVSAPRACKPGACR